MRKTLLLGACVVLLAAAVPADAQTRFGIRGGAYFNAPDPFIGADVLFPLARNLFANPSLELVFGDRENNFIVNGDVHYDLPAGRGSTFWLGGGLAIVVRDYDAASRDNETDIGLNLLAGIALTEYRDFIPYLQGKVLISDDTRAVIAVGLRF